MLGEAFRRLYPFQRIENYRYIGFGSIYFSDFQLVHCALGIDDMISIEKDEAAAACFDFNKPYRTIDLKYGHSSVILPTLAWSKPTILWLDYDGKLATAMLADIDTFCLKCLSGSVLLISVNAQPEFDPTEKEREEYKAETGEEYKAGAYRLRKLNALVGDKVPLGVRGGDLRGRGLASVSKKIIDNQIAAQLVVRNALLPADDKIIYKQLFNFHYRDGALMITIGGLFFRAADADLYEACSFEKLHFIRSGDEHYEIRIPCLTAKEIRHLNGQLPIDPASPLSAPGVPASDLATYAEVYRYFPAFSEVLFT